MSVKRAGLTAFALGCTGFFLWLAVRKVDFSELLVVLRSADWVWLLPMAVLVFLDLGLRALRWRVLLSRARPEPIAFKDLFELEAIGLAVNNVLFMRLGELARAVLASRRLGVSMLAVLASVAVERALDVAALLTIFIIADKAAPGFALPSVVRAAALLLAGAVGALIVLALAEETLAEGGMGERALRRWPKLHEFVEKLALGAAVLRSPSAAASCAFLSLALWSADAVIYWAGARALGLGAMIDYPRAVLTLSWAGASSAIPAAPGAIGTFEAVVASIVVKFGATQEAAFAYAFACHILMFALVTVTGLALLYRVGLSLGDLQKEVEKR